MARDEYHHGSLRQALIDGGLSLIVREGLAGFSLRRLSQELGVSHAAPYRHFASREELLETIVSESRIRFDSALKASVEGPGEAREKLYRLGEAYVRFFLKNTEILILFNILPKQLAQAGAELGCIFASPPLSAEEGEASALMRDEGFMVLRNTASTLMSGFPDMSEKDVLLGYWAKVHGLATILAAHPDYFDPEELDSGLRRVVRQAF